MSTIFLSQAYIDKILSYKKDNEGPGAEMSRTVVNLVALDPVSPEKIQEAKDLGVTIRTMQEVMDAGSEKEGAPAFVEPKPEDCYILSYTSGTTGDPKGVKMTHKQILSFGHTPPER